MDRSLRLPAATLGALAARTLIRPRARLCLSTLRDTVVRSVVERALDSAIAADLSRPPAHAPSALAPAQAPAAGSAAFGGSRGSSLPSWVTGGGGTGVAGDSGEADALTWKSMVDSPVNLVADANELTDAALYPAGSPLWDADGRVEEIEGPSFSDGAGPSYDDDSAGGAGVDSGGGLSGDSGGGGVLAALWGSGAARTVVNGIGGSNTGSRRAGATGAADLAAASAGGGVAGLDLTAFPGASALDPFDTVREELSSLNASVRALLGVDHPVLETVARYFFNWEGGKKVRPALVLLMAHAVNAHVAAAAGEAYMPSGRLFLSREALAQGAAAAAAGASAHDDEGGGVGSGGSFVGGSASLPAAARPSLPAQFALPLQRRLAEVAELIHTASLLHDDVIDGADTRRGASSVNAAFGNKLAVLAGDFLLARASVALARLRNVPTVELLSTVIEHLVKGEVMQMRPPPSRGGASRAAFDAYLRKSYYKTGSLMANSCRAVGLLGSYPDAVCDAAFRYGLHVGVAFQLVDDALDYSATASALGKPALADVRQGLATAPLLYAAGRFPALLALIDRKFEAPGDVDAAVAAVAAASGVALTRRLAAAHGAMALRALEELSPSPARTALAALVARVLCRER